MDQNVVLLTLLGMGVVTYLPRLLPLLVLTGGKGSASALSPWIEGWLRHVPAAVLAAMTLPALLVVDGQANLSAGNLYLWAAIPTLLVAWKTRSLVGSVLAGMAVVALGRLFGGL
jgi:branched-subunit amino acid transport protein